MLYWSKSSFSLKKSPVLFWPSLKHFKTYIAASRADNPLMLSFVVEIQIRKMIPASKNYDAVNETETFILYVGATVHSFKEGAWGVTKVGDRIKLVSTDNPYTRLKPGDSGVVWDITTFELSNQEIKQIWIHWDNGNRLALIEGKDEWEVIGSESK